MINITAYGCQCWQCKKIRREAYDKYGWGNIRVSGLRPNATLHEHLTRRARDLSLAASYGRKLSEEEMTLVDIFDPVGRNQLEYERQVTESSILGSLPRMPSIKAEVSGSLTWQDFNIHRQDQLLNRLKQSETVSIDTETDYSFLESYVMAGIKVDMPNLDPLLKELRLISPKGTPMILKYRIIKSDGTLLEWKPAADAGPAVSVATTDKELLLALKNIPPEKRSEYTISVISEENIQPVATKEKEINLLSVDGAYSGILTRAIGVVKDSTTTASRIANVLDTTREQVQDMVNNSNRIEFTDVLDAALVNYFNQVSELGAAITAIRQSVAELATVKRNKT
jgi:hypothetical protein